ncbi:MAG: DMT family transporter [Rhizobiales bacterium]|nr:DMT family transporter [Hyphomicrobiales bacterium]
MIARTSFAASAALLLTMLFWGSAGTFVRSLALAIEPENSLAIRYALLAVINIAGLLIAGDWRIDRADIPRFLFAGLIGMAGYNLFFNYGVAGILAATGPLVIALGAWLVWRERLTIHFLIGVGLALLGALALFWNDLIAATGSHVSLYGVMLVFLSVVCWAIYTITCRPLFARYSAFAVTAWTMIIAAPPIILNASAPLLTVTAGLDARQWAELIYLIFANGLLATCLWNYGNAKLGNAHAGAFLYLIPVIAVVSGAIFLGETVTPAIILGGVLTLAGVAIAQIGPTLRSLRVA